MGHDPLAAKCGWHDPLKGTPGDFKMASIILGRKVGMTRLYDDQGVNIPVTVIQAGPCFVSQIKTT